MINQDRDILRALARQYVEVANDPVQERRRDLWRRHNSFQGGGPLIYVRAVAWDEMPQSKCLCEGPFLRRYEYLLRYYLFWRTCDDDSIFEPWITVPATFKCYGWGLTGERRHSDQAGGAFKVDYPIKRLDDIEKLRRPWHEIDEGKTAEDVLRLSDTIGDIITINVDRSPPYRKGSADLSTDLGFLRGIEHFMLDMLDNPQWLHRLMKFLSDGVLAVHQQADAAGDWGLTGHLNQAMPYAAELPDPAANVSGVTCSQLWGYMSAQEFTAVSPAMHEEFLLQYQLPILSRFGLAAYGCCEDLTDKIDMLRQIRNLRRIAVAPAADVVKCAERIGQDYILSYRPSPADMVSYDFDADRVRSILTRDLAACRDCHVDITLKDVETVQGDPNRIRHWVRITREVIDEVFG